MSSTGVDATIFSMLRASWEDDLFITATASTMVLGRKCQETESMAHYYPGQPLAGGLDHKRVEKMNLPLKIFVQTVNLKNHSGSHMLNTLHRPAFGIVALLVTAAAPLFGQTNKDLLQENFPFQGACISAKAPEKNVAMKGIAIRVGNGASMLFDTDLLRVAAGWTGEYITTTGVTFDGGHGGHPSIDGKQVFGTAVVPGWADAHREFKDPRSEPFGPLPAPSARWGGLYVNGMDVVLAYTIHGVQIYEQPGSRKVDDAVVFTRTFHVSNATAPLTLLVNDASASPGVDLAISFTDLPTGVEFKKGERNTLHIPRGTAAFTFAVGISNGSSDQVKSALQQKPAILDFRKGGPGRWPQEVLTKGVLNTSKTPDGAYVTDSLTPPLENPWKRRVRFGGLDFFRDGKRAALCTWDGDVWIVSGIDEKLENLKWRRFASGMYETLGLKIVDDVIYTSGRDQITRYHDLNNDGEADFYENFNNEVTSTEGFHEFLFDLQTDRDGNFYFAKAAPVRPGGHLFETISRHAGALMKVSKDGKKLEVVATGFRAPNGIGVGPNGELTTGDNEGTWMPTCPINWVKPGSFHGVEHTAHTKPVPTFTPPLCWLSKNGWDNSGGGQVWVSSDKWGPFNGELLHTSYGECAIYLVMKQQLASGLMQGGVVRIPVRFSSSAMRPKFNPVDGQLYVAGLQGWQTKAVRSGGLDRIRYTGKPVYSVRDLKVNKEGVHLTFTQPLDEKDATDLQNWAVERWNYERAEHYGSPELSVADPKKHGHDKVDVTAAKISADKKTVTLQVADLRPVDQMQIKFNIATEDGTLLDQTVLHTVHQVP